MAHPITGISSMATRRALGELTERYAASTGKPVSIEAIGGVDAARRVRAGEPFDLVVLADDVIAKLEAEGHVLAGTAVGFVRSAMALAVKAGARRPDIGDGEAVKAALMTARSIGYSTGPSGTHLVEILKTWGLDPAGDAPRLVQARPGVPVAALVAGGDAEIGVQQLSEFLGEAGIAIVGLAPPPVQSVTTFSIGVGAGSTRVEEARALIAFLNGPEAAETKRRFGMEPAQA
ncbi:molybdate transport system substrate-binding protein [Roseiarcus fermentans]|uniref:Molybdate transport system substrate-binding protein n=1 Tax=Roseiarcus fermentans TaxID=1473586 RepID=A0A366EN50_9HYPH|nr:substrate-binding domain-containing protein [Roseiarcus fermentans]RBP02885.1 molybdate transport system substrate-binding protein [Roseiarcus fermentans]